ncbi:MAG: type I methionyl aminopeptidase [Bacteroidota bacterium]
MIFVKSEEEIALIKEGAEILSKAHGRIAREIKPGVTTQQLDTLAEEFIRDHDGISSFKGYKKFPATLCTSVNDYVVHGLPGSYVLKEGDIISIDCGVYYKGFHSDAAFTYPVGMVSDEVMRLLKVTKEALYRGIDRASVGNRTGDIGYAIQHYVQRYGYSVVRELVGHGVGRELHEDPQVPNYGKQGSGTQLKKGMVLAIEPMINLGKRQIVQGKGGQFRTLDGSATAHFEHTVAILEKETEILTTYKYIEEVFKF